MIYASAGIPCQLSQQSQRQRQTLEFLMQILLFQAFTIWNQESRSALSAVATVGRRILLHRSSTKWRWGKVAVQGAAERVAAEQSSSRKGWQQQQRQKQQRAACCSSCSQNMPIIASTLHIRPWCTMAKRTSSAIKCWTTKRFIFVDRCLPTV